MCQHRIGIEPLLKTLFQDGKFSVRSQRKQNQFSLERFMTVSNSFRWWCHILWPCASALLLRESEPKLYIPSNIYKPFKKLLCKAIWADKRWAGFWQVSLYNKKTEILKDKAIQILILNFQVNLECILT